MDGDDKCDDDSEYKAEVDEANLAEEEEQLSQHGLYQEVQQIKAETEQLNQTASYGGYGSRRNCANKPVFIVHQNHPRPSGLEAGKSFGNSCKREESSLMSIAAKEMKRQ